MHLSVGIKLQGKLLSMLRKTSLQFYRLCACVCLKGWKGAKYLSQPPIKVNHKKTANLMSADFFGVIITPTTFFL